MVPGQPNTPTPVAAEKAAKDKESYDADKSIALGMKSHRNLTDF